jgi:hypothetical protein
MNVLTLIAIVGIGSTVLVLAGIIIFGRVQKRYGRGGPTGISDALKMRTFAPSILRVARAGTNAAPQMSLGTVIMRPALGLRFVSIAPGALILFILWGPNQHITEYGMLLGGGLTAAVFYAAIYIANYEVRYDDEGVTAPDGFFRERHYPWIDLASVKDNESYFLHMRFHEHGKLKMQKYLVGMPTFLTFLSDVETLNRKI